MCQDITKTAKDYTKIAKQVNHKGYSEILARIEIQIENAAKRGEFRIDWHSDLPYEVEQKLRQRGFKIEIFDDQKDREYYKIISWFEED